MEQRPQPLSTPSSSSYRARVYVPSAILAMLIFLLFLVNVWAIVEYVLATMTAVVEWMTHRVQDLRE